MNLSEAVVRLEPLRGDIRRVEVDVERFFGEAVVFVLRPLNTRQLFAVFEDAERMRISNPGWPRSFARVVATMAMAHVSPLPDDGQAVGRLYAEMAERNPNLIGYLSERYYAAFPDLADMGGEVDARKND